MSSWLLNQRMTIWSRTQNALHEPCNYCLSSQNELPWPVAAQWQISLIHNSLTHLCTGELYPILPRFWPRRSCDCARVPYVFQGVLLQSEDRGHQQGARLLHKARPFVPDQRLLPAGLSAASCLQATAGVTGLFDCFTVCSAGASSQMQPDQCLPPAGLSATSCLLATECLIDCSPVCSVHARKCSVCTHSSHILAQASFLVLELKYTPEAAWAPFEKLPRGDIAEFRDATFTPPDYGLSVLSCLQGLHKGIECGWYSPDTFDMDKYLHLQDPRHTGMTFITPKLVASQAPVGAKRREEMVSIYVLLAKPASLRI